eukprot:679365-Rhodomonas_salina.1
MGKKQKETARKSQRARSCLRTRHSGEVEGWAVPPELQVCCQIKCFAPRSRVLTQRLFAFDFGMHGARLSSYALSGTDTAH